MLLVTGPSGNVGAELTAHLARCNTAPWRVGSRHPERLTDTLAGSLAEIVRLDFHDRSTWAPALEGVDQLFLLFPLPTNTAAKKAIVPFIAAAAAAGCRHAVYISVLGADRARFIPHFTVEAALRHHIPDTTILRCGFFTQNLHRKISTHGIDIAEHHELFIPAGNGATAFLDARDAAEVAATVLADPDPHRGAVYHLTGAQRLTMGQVAEMLSATLGYPVRYTRPGLLAFALRLRRRGVGYDTIMFMAAVYTLTRLGINQQITTDVGDLLHRPARTVEDYLRVSAWRWHRRDWT